jgi:hypothetical protein
MEISNLVGNLPRAGFFSLSKTLETRFLRCMGIFMIEEEED